MEIERVSQGSAAAALVPIMGMVFIAFLVVGVAMPVLPLHVHERLGLSTFVVGLVAGSQFAASLVSRVWAGSHADLRGAKHAVVAGLVAAIAVATTAVPLVTLMFAAPLQRVAATTRDRPQLSNVIAAVLLPGTGLALSSVGFGAVTAFVSLLFAARGWTVWPAFTSFAVAFIGARVFFGHLADRRGGAKVALVFVLIEAAGQALIWIAPGSVLALTGAALSGFGYSLVYPVFGVEAVRLAPPQSRGLMMGAYTGFLDLTLGLASPALGLIAGVAGLGCVFLASALSVMCAALVAARLLGVRPIFSSVVPAACSAAR